MLKSPVVKRGNEIFECDVLHFLRNTHLSKESLQFLSLLLLVFNTASHIRIDDIPMALFPTTNGMRQNHGNRNGEVSSFHPF